jgi:hypothetical protein
MQQLRPVRLSMLQRHLQRIAHQVRLHVLGHRPADDLATEAIQHRHHWRQLLRVSNAKERDVPNSDVFAVSPDGGSVAIAGDTKDGTGSPATATGGTVLRDSNTAQRPAGLARPRGFRVIFGTTVLGCTLMLVETVGVEIRGLDGVVAVLAVHGVGAVAAVEQVVTGFAVDLVAAGTAGERVVAGAAVRSWTVAGRPGAVLAQHSAL